jgi:hypothetical protein
MRLPAPVALSAVDAQVIDGPSGQVNGQGRRSPVRASNLASRSRTHPWVRIGRYSPCMSAMRPSIAAEPPARAAAPCQQHQHDQQGLGLPARAPRL